MSEEIKNRVETMPVGIVVERRDSSHPWADNIWLPVAVIPGAPAMDPAPMIPTLKFLAKLSPLRSCLNECATHDSICWALNAK